MMAVLSHSFKTQEDKMAQVKLQADEVLNTNSNKLENN